MDEPAEVTLLAEEAQLTATTAQQRYTAFGQFGSLGVAIIVASASLASGKAQEVILLAAPPVLSLIFTIMAQHLADASALNFYHEELQRRLSARLPAESRLRYAAMLTRRPYWSVLPARLLAALIATATFVLGGVTAYHASSYRGVVIFYYWTSVGLSLVALSLGFLDILTGRRRATAVMINAN